MIPYTNRAEIFIEETAQIITDILTRLNRIDSRLTKIERSIEALELSNDRNWLNNLVDKVNKERETKA